MEKFRLANALGDHMVLQRDVPVRLWGKGAAEGDVIYAVLGPYEAWGQVDETLTWELYLPPMPANTVPQRLQLSDGTDQITAEDVLIGDVWVINGQSNAELTMQSANSNGKGIYDEEMQDIFSKDNIRVIKQQRCHATDHPECMLVPQFDLPEPQKSSWRIIAGKEDILDMSAMGFFFAKKLSRTMQASVPLGIVSAASGGSPMMELIMPELVAPMGYTKPEKENIPLAGIYNALMAPLQKMTIKGMLFYQGESEQWRYQAYPYQLKWYVEELRRRFETDFPFYYVQISSHCGPGIEQWKKIEEVRYAQYKMLGLLENCHMIVPMDVGGREENADWAHPPYKKPVGERAALCVLANEYGIGNIEYAASPVPCCWRFDEDAVTVHFDYVGDGLTLLSGEKLTGFEAAGADGKYKKVRGRIVSEDTVIFKGVKEPVTLRYAYMHVADAEHANLGSSTGMPCAAFEIFKEDDGLLH